MSRKTATKPRLVAVDGTAPETPVADTAPAPVPAKPYEATEAEKVVIAKYWERMKASPDLPKLKLKATIRPDGTRNTDVSIEHPKVECGYILQSEALKSNSWAFYDGITRDMLHLAADRDAIDDKKVNFVLSFVAGIEPRDQVETLLATQMAAIHAATINYVTRLNQATDIERRESAERGLNKLARTFTAQVEALKRYRSKGEQRVYVERVNVSEGGQAIVGNVTKEGGGG